MFASGLPVVKVLLSHGARVNARNDFGITALMGAASNGRADIVEALIEARAELELKDNSGKSALRRAIERNHGEVSELLELKGARE